MKYKNAYNNANSLSKWCVRNNLKYLLYFFVILSIPIYFHLGLVEAARKTVENINEDTDFINDMEKPTNE